MRAAILALALSVVVGLALGALLTGTGPGASGIVGGEYWIAVIVASSVYLGWHVAQLMPAPTSLIAGPALVVVMIGVLLGIKYTRLPDAPLVGDGFPIVVLIYAAGGALGALAGQTPRLRARSAAGAARTGMWLAAITVAVSVAMYTLASVSGS
jgi:hypothetical protein